MTEEESQTFMLEAVEGLMSLMQVLVMALQKSGNLETDVYARLLLDFRKDLVPANSFQATLFDRMLRQLVDEEPEVVRRRWAMHALPTAQERSPADGES